MAVGQAGRRRLRVTSAPPRRGLWTPPHVAVYPPCRYTAFLVPLGVAFSTMGKNGAWGWMGILNLIAFVAYCVSHPAGRLVPLWGCLALPGARVGAWA